MAQREVTPSQHSKDTVEDGDETGEGREEALGLFLGYVSSREERLGSDGNFTDEVRHRLNEEKVKAKRVEGVDFATAQGARLALYGEPSQIFLN